MQIGTHDRTAQIRILRTALGAEGIASRSSEVLGLLTNDASRIAVCARMHA